ncbi:MAG: hypothetical protein H7329_16245 [Opitutaceae bacterium]|nr:hypothetical protein [Cytophagales bacterium]
MVNLSQNMLNSNIRNLTSKEKQLLAFLMFMLTEIKENETPAKVDFFGIEADISINEREIHYQDFVENGFVQQDFTDILATFVSATSKIVTLRSESSICSMCIFSNHGYSEADKKIFFKFNNSFLCEIERNSFRKKK